MEPTVLVIGAAGVRGAAVVDSLQRRGIAVLALRRRPTQPHETPGDVSDPTSLDAALARATVLVHISPLALQGTDSRTAFGNVLTSAARRGVPVIHHTGSAYVEEAELPALAEADRQSVAAWQSTGLPISVVRPTLYLENLLQPWSMPSIEAGEVVYPLRTDTKIAWTSASDLGEATAALIGSAPTTVTVTGPRGLNGDELAAELSTGSGRTLRYRYLPEDEFEAGLAPVFGPLGAKLVADNYRATNADPTGNVMAHPTGKSGLSAAEWAGRYMRNG